MISNNARKVELAILVVVIAMIAVLIATNADDTKDAPYSDREGFSIEEVSVLMGHASTRTTEHYYCRKSESDVIKQARKLW